MTTRATILEVALTRFARYGYLGTSIQQIADDAGTSKASVLYHFASKEALLEAAVEPALAAFDEILARVPEGEAQHAFDRGDLEGLVTAFVDVLLSNAAALTIYVGQRGALVDVPIIERTNELVAHLAQLLVHEAEGEPAVLRLSIGLAGAAFIVGAEGRDDLPRLEPDRMRAVLIETIIALCPPLPAERATGGNA